jgi:hypothetical protein
LRERKKRTFIFEESATVFTSELRNVIFGELVKGFVEDGSEGGDGASAVHRFRFRQGRVSGTMYYEIERGRERERERECE